MPLPVYVKATTMGLPQKRNHEAIKTNSNEVGVLGSA